MATKISVRCPCCGMFAYLEKVKSLKRVELDIYEKTMGGRIPREMSEDYKKKRGTAGILTWTEISDPDLLEEVKALWRKRIKAASELLKE